MGLRQCNSVYTSARRIGWWRNVFLFFFGWWGWSWKGSLKVAAFQRNLPHSLNSLLGNLLWWNMFHLEMLFVQQEFFCQTRKLGAPALHPFPQLLELFSLASYHPPSFQPSVPLKCAIDRSLSGAPSLLGLAVRLCFISPTKHWARMRDLCARFPLRLRSPNVKLVYLWSWQSFSTLRMLLGMIITWVCAWATMQCGQGQPQMVVPVEDINSGNVKTTLRQVKAEGAKHRESETERG